MIKTSLIINTAALDPLVGLNHNPFRKKNYHDRKDLLVSGVLSWAHEEFDEVIVAGTFQEGDTYQYVEVQPRFRDRRDALYQREYGARYATGDVLVFCHDDHAPARDFARKLQSNYYPEPGAFEEVCWEEEWDLLIPLRRHSLTNEILNNGKDEGYMGGHCLVMKRWLWAEVPWTILDTEYWDVPMTQLWKNALYKNTGAKLLWVDDLEHFDLEAEEDET